MTARLTLAVTAAEKDLLERAARLNGRSLSSELAVRVRRTLGEREGVSGVGAVDAVDVREPSAPSRSPSGLSLAGRDQAQVRSTVGAASGAAASKAGREESEPVPAPLSASDLAGQAKPDPRVQTKGRR